MKTTFLSFVAVILGHALCISAEPASANQSTIEKHRKELGLQQKLEVACRRFIKAEAAGEPDLVHDALCADLRRKYSVEAIPKYDRAGADLDLSFKGFAVMQSNQDQSMSAVKVTLPAGKIGDQVLDGTREVFFLLERETKQFKSVTYTVWKVRYAFPSRYSELFFGNPTDAGEGIQK